MGKTQSTLTLTPHEFGRLYDAIVLFDTKQIAVSQLIRDLEPRVSMNAEQIQRLVKRLKKLRAGIQDDALSAYNVLYGQ